MKVLYKLMLAAGFVVLVLSCQNEINYIDPDQLYGLIQNKTEDYLLVDVRTEEEYQSGHIPTAVNIPYTEIGEKIPVEDKSALIIVYCRSGNRSAIAKDTLQEKGYNRIIDFGGIDRWNRSLIVPGE